MQYRFFSVALAFSLYATTILAAHKDDFRIVLGDRFGSTILCHNETIEIIIGGIEEQRKNNDPEPQKIARINTVIRCQLSGLVDAAFTDLRFLMRAIDKCFLSPNGKRKLKEYIKSNVPEAWRKSL